MSNFASNSPMGSEKICYQLSYQSLAVSTPKLPQMPYIYWTEVVPRLTQNSALSLNGSFASRSWRCKIKGYIVQWPTKQIQKLKLRSWWLTARRRTIPFFQNVRKVQYTSVMVPPAVLHLLIKSIENGLFQKSYNLVYESIRLFGNEKEINDSWMSTRSVRKSNTARVCEAAHCWSAHCYRDMNTDWK